MDLKQVAQQLDAFEREAALLQPHNLEPRTKALDELRVLREVLRYRQHEREHARLKARLLALEEHLRRADQDLFGSFRILIQSGRWTADELRTRLDRYTSYRPSNGAQRHIGYDALDRLLDGVLQVEPPPDPSYSPSAEMIHLVPTPARAILDLVDRVPWATQDVFYDLGSGLGQVVILVHLLAGVRSKGVEVDPAYCAYARACADALGLRGIELLHADARTLDYGDGTVFFLFTPFTGQMLAAVLGQLREVAARRPIAVCTYGTCTLSVAREPWLRSVDGQSDDEFALAIFRNA